ncbi:MAG: LysR family transcriptional regulator [Pirellulales bacterium]
MHVKSLKIFCDVVAHRSFSRAAEEHGTSQSHVSQLVHQLEEKLGVRLLDRSKRPFVLTSEGHLFYKGCRHLVDDYEALEEEVRTLHQDLADRVRIASIYSVGLSHVSRCVKEFLTCHPRANVRVEYQHPERVYELVEADQVDLGLVSYPKSTRQVTATAWFDEPMVVVCGPEHPLARRERLTRGDLHGLEMVTFDDGLKIREELDRFLDEAGVEVVVAMEFDNTETLKGALEIGAGFGILPYPTVAREVQSGSLVALPFADANLVRPLGIIIRRGRRPHRATQHLVEFLQASVPALQRSGWPPGGEPPRGGAADGDEGAADGSRSGPQAERSTP